MTQREKAKRLKQLNQVIKWLDELFEYKPKLKVKKVTITPIEDNVIPRGNKRELMSKILKALKSTNIEQKIVVLLNSEDYNLYGHQWVDFPYAPSIPVVEDVNVTEPTTRDATEEEISLFYLRKNQVKVLKNEIDRIHNESIELLNKVNELI